MTTNNTFSNQNREENNTFYKTNVANNVAQRNSQDLERVADTSKTLDHIVDATEKVSLTEQWKKGELPKGYYYAEDDGEELIIHIQGKNGSVMGDNFDLKATDWIKPITPVPSYGEWQPFTDPYFKGLTTKHISELAKKSIRLTTQHCEDNERIEKLEELLKECQHYIVNTPVYPQGDDNKQFEIHRLVDKINEVLK
jgi:hypothetical protein